MIEELTEEQEALIPKYVERFKNVGLNTARMDKKAAVAAVKMAYDIANLPMPDNVVFCKGPNDAEKKIREDSDGEFGVFSGVYSGSFNAGSIAYFTYMQEVLGVKGIEDVQGLSDMTMHCGWVNLFDTHVYISERPTRILFDEEERLHCENGPALMYEDGFEVYSWHGQRVPKRWIMEGITAKEALTCENLEQRRAACEIVTWDKILDELNVEVIDEDEDPQIGTLVAVEIPDIGREHFIRVLCGTGRTHALTVPPECKTALEANAWTYGVGPEEYKPEVRT